MAGFESARFEMCDSRFGTRVAKTCAAECCSVVVAVETRDNVVVLCSSASAVVVLYPSAIAVVACASDAVVACASDAVFDGASDAVFASASDADSGAVVAEVEISAPFASMASLFLAIATLS